MNGKLRVCRKCLPGQKNEEAFYEDLSRYIQRMDEDLKVDQQIYEKRLNICSTCDRLMNGMCRLCGCLRHLFPDSPAQVTLFFPDLQPEYIYNMDKHQ